MDWIICRQILNLLLAAGKPVTHPRSLNFYTESMSLAPTVFKSRIVAISTFRENASKCHNNEIFLDINAIGDLESPKVLLCRVGRGSDCIITRWR
jgi:hypothetical protein